jgi:hypothetical protein
LVDALVASGDETAIAERVDQHLLAGAGHVTLHMLIDQDHPAERALIKQQANYRRLADAVVRS